MNQALIYVVRRETATEPLQKALWVCWGRSGSISSFHFWSSPRRLWPRAPHLEGRTSMPVKWDPFPHSRPIDTTEVSDSRGPEIHIVVPNKWLVFMKRWLFLHSHFQLLLARSLDEENIFRGDHNICWKGNSRAKWRAYKRISSPLCQHPKSQRDSSSCSVLSLIGTDGDMGRLDLAVNVLVS